MSSLQQLYEDSLYPSASAFKKIAKEAGHALGDVKKFIDAQTPSQAFKRVKVEPRGKISHASVDAVLMMDLMDVTRWQRLNDNNRWILNILDWHSRYLWSFPLKTKEPGPIAELLKGVIESYPEIEYWKKQGTSLELIDMRVVSDDGSEFKGPVSSLLRGYPNVSRLVAIPDRRKSTAPVERVNGTLLLMINRCLLAKKTERWIDGLGAIVRAYNNRVHSATKRRPAELLQEGHVGVMDLDNLPVRRFAVEDVVRKITSRVVFVKKGITPTVSLTTHVITEIRGSFYVLDNGDEMLETELVAAVEAAPDVVLATHVEASRANRTTNRVNRLQRKEAAIGHEAELNEDGSVRLKARVLPSNETRVRKTPRRYQ